MSLAMLECGLFFFAWLGIIGFLPSIDALCKTYRYKIEIQNKNEIQDKLKYVNLSLNSHFLSDASNILILYFYHSQT